MMKIANYLDAAQNINVNERSQTNILKSMLFNHLPHASFVYAQLEPGESQYPHYHKTGMDIFIIQSGSGVVHVGEIERDTLKLINVTEYPIKAGNVYFIDIFQMHAIENTGQNVLEWLNVAPSSHGDKNEDLFIMSE